MGKSSINWQFSMAMLNNHRVICPDIVGIDDLDHLLKHVGLFIAHPTRGLSIPFKTQEVLFLFSSPR